MRLVLRDQATEANVPDAGLVALLARANRWFDALRKGLHDSIASLAEEQRQNGRDLTRTVYLAFLAPDIVERIARGEQPIGLGVRRLLAMPRCLWTGASSGRRLGWRSWLRTNVDGGREARVSLGRAQRRALKTRGSHVRRWAAEGYAILECERRPETAVNPRGKEAY